MSIRSGEEIIARPTEMTAGAMGHRQRRRRRTDRVIVKLKSTPEAVSRFRLAAKETGRKPFLATLVDNGCAKNVQPIFAPSPSVGASIAHRLLAAASAASDGRSNRSLFSVVVDPATDAFQLAEHLGQLGDEVEYAFVPPVKRYFGGASTASGPDPLLSRQWGHAAVKANFVRQRSDFVDAHDVVVAVVDSGIDEGHPDLKNSLHSYTNYIHDEDKRDIVGHGTHVAGIIAAGINNAVGISGLCAAKIMAVKGLPHPTSEWDPDEYYRALDHPIDNGADIINLSLGGGFDPAEKDIIEDALHAGIVVVAAMGNEYQDGNPIEYPAAYPGVIAVGASDEIDRRAPFSSTGSHISLLAPGVRVLSTVPRYPSVFASTLLYDSWPGTSMATPFVAAAVALMRAKKTELTTQEIREGLEKSADRVPLQSQQPDEEHGWGRLNLDRALDQVSLE